MVKHTEARDSTYYVDVIPSGLGLGMLPEIEPCLSRASTINSQLLDKISGIPLGRPPSATQWTPSSGVERHTCAGAAPGASNGSCGEGTRAQRRNKTFTMWSVSAGGPRA